jgi:membrane protein YdbS with pleckstrin-like domain
MRFIRKKNLQEREELLYVPHLHWMYTIRHAVQSLPFFLLLLILWFAVKKYAGFIDFPGEFGGFTVTQAAYFVFKHVFLAALVVVMLIFVCRIFQYLNTEYGVTNKRLIIKKGVFRVVVAEIPFDRIESMCCVQGILGRGFNYGTVFISGVGGMMPVFFMVHRPFALRRKIADIIEKNRTVTVVHGGLPKAKPPKPEPLPEEEPVFRYGTFVRVLPENRR